MNVLIVDTSVWIDFLNGKTIPELESALKEVRVFLSPIVLSEVLSGFTKNKDKKEIISFFKELRFFEANFDHWVKVGKLRNHLASKGLNTSIPDSHIAQCALDLEGYLLSKDNIFKKIAQLTPLKLVGFV